MLVETMIQLIAKFIFCRGRTPLFMRQAAVPFGRPDGFSHTVPIVPSTSGLAALPPTTESNASTCSILKSKKKIENGAVVEIFFFKAG